MAKRKNTQVKPEVKTRESEPRTMEKKGVVEIACPFCVIPHPISVGEESPCGTMLMIKAVQVIYPTRTVNKRGLTCIKCRKGGKEMVKFNLGYVHLHECSPGTRLMAEAPAFSRWAGIIFSLPDAVQKFMERWIGKANAVKEVDPEGQDTGNVLGYFFYKPTQGG